MTRFPKDIELRMIQNLTTKGSRAECPACRSEDISQERIKTDKDDIIWDVDVSCGECGHKASFACVFTVLECWWCSLKKEAHAQKA